MEMVSGWQDWIYTMYIRQILKLFIQFQPKYFRINFHVLVPISIMDGRRARQSVVGIYNIYIYKYKFRLPFMCSICKCVLYCVACRIVSIVIASHVKFIIKS